MNINQYDEVVIPFYFINRSKDKQIKFKEKFKDRTEFQFNVVEVNDHESEALAAWKGIVLTVEEAIRNKDSVIIICQDGHEFTAEYSKTFLIDAIIEAGDKGTNILLGGFDSFGQAIPLGERICWVDNFIGSQFMIIYSGLFQRILEEPFEEDDTLDNKFSIITSNKMVLFPFISEGNNSKHCEDRLKNIYRARRKYNTLLMEQSKSMNEEDV